MTTCLSDALVSSRPDHRGGCRVAPLIGGCRPGLDEDLGERFLHGLTGMPVSIACVLVHPEDRLIPVARALGLEVLPLPGMLCGPRARIRSSLADPECQQRLEDWLTRFRAHAPDVGLVFYGWWVPPALYQVPRCGMINFHPAPLPQHRGFEPDTAAVLYGLPSTHGTFHRIAHDFDTGDVVWETESVPLTRWETPPSVLDKVTRTAISELEALFQAIRRGQLAVRPQPVDEAGEVNLHQLAPESVIDWSEDDHATIDRRNRAFNGQPSHARLRAWIDSRLCCIRRIATRPGDFPGAAGQTLGRYPEDAADGATDAAFRGAILIRTREGIAACVIDHVCGGEAGQCRATGRCMARHTAVIPPGQPHCGLDGTRLRQALGRWNAR